MREPLTLEAFVALVRACGDPEVPLAVELRHVRGLLRYSSAGFVDYRLVAGKTECRYQGQLLMDTGRPRV